jgi:FAD/FMN-containing dehydrogenase
VRPADAASPPDEHWNELARDVGGRLIKVGSPLSACAGAPAVTDAVALAIRGALGQPAFPGIPGYQPDMVATPRKAERVERAMNEIRKLLLRVGSYVWETDFFHANWQDAFWGNNSVRLRAIKHQYDPDVLFFLLPRVGSEDCSADTVARRDAH